MAAGDEDDVVVSANPHPAPTPAPASSSVEERLRKLEEAQATHEKALEKTRNEKPWWIKPFSVVGYLQAEYQSHEDSQDQLQQGGILLNKDRFVLHRARLRLDGEWQYVHIQMELDGNTVKGPQFRIWHGFGELKLPQIRPTEATRDVPLAAMTAGLFDNPFGYELDESPRTRFFMERTTASQAFFSKEPDVGVWFHGGLYFLRWSLAALNGEPLDGSDGLAGQSPHAAKDVVFRVGVDTHPRENLRITANVSGLRGHGFHAGTDATKNQILWKDLNGDGQIQPSELVGSPATAATPSQDFVHWAIGADLQARFRTRLGETTVLGEVVVAQNFDRNLYIGDPVLTGVDIRELGFYAGFTQEITKYGVVGFRYDYYDPNSDFLDKRSGRLLPQNQTIQTFSPLGGLVLPDRARLLFQYDIIKNHYARDSSGIPTNLAANTIWLRLQVQL